MKDSEKPNDSPKKETKKNSLVNNINAKKKAGTSNSKSKSTILDKEYHDMENNWEEKK